MHSSVPLRVVVLAPDDAVRDSLTVLLQAAGCIALSFTSGAELLSSPTATRADCLVLDEQIEDMTPWEMLERLHKSSSTIKIVLFTERRSPVLVQRAAQAGVAQVLAAPVMAPRLIDFLRRIRMGGNGEAGE